MSRPLPTTLLLAISVFSSRAFADRTIEVTATGSGQAAITTYSLRFIASGSDTLAVDALKSFKAVRKRAEKAFAEFEIPGMTVTGEGLEIKSAIPGQDPFGRVVMVNGINQPGPKKKVQVQETLVVKLPAAASSDAVGKASVGSMKNLGEILDVATEVGLEPAGVVDPQQAYYMAANQMPAGPKLITVGVADGKKLERDAYQAALEEARRKASQLADLAGLTLGTVDLIRVESTTGAAPDPRSSGQATQAVSLRVRFAIGS